MTRQLLREIRHQALVALCQAYAERHPYTNHYPLVALQQHDRT